MKFCIIIEITQNNGHSEYDSVKEIMLQIV